MFQIGGRFRAVVAKVNLSRYWRRVKGKLSNLSEVEEKDRKLRMESALIPFMAVITCHDPKNHHFLSTEVTQGESQFTENSLMKKSHFPISNFFLYFITMS